MKTNSKGSSFLLTPLKKVLRVVGMENIYSIGSDMLPILTRGNVRVEWVNLGEGNSGDYDESDPNDVNLLRFDVSRFDGNEWVEVPDGSYCTQMPASSPHQVLKVGLKIIMDTIYDDVANHGKAKRLCESLSWMK